MDDLQNSGFGDDGFAFFFELDEGINVDVFDFPGNDIGLTGKLADVGGVVETALNEMVGDGRSGAVLRLF